MQSMRTINPTMRKRISVSQKRQITIPIDFFNALGVGNEVECVVRDGALVIRPVREDSGAFDEEILADLLAQGFADEELLTQFKQARRQIRPAVEALLDEAERAAAGQTSAFSYDEVFDGDGV